MGGRVVVVRHPAEDRNCGHQVFFGRSNLYVNDRQVLEFSHLMIPTDEIVNEVLNGGLHVSSLEKSAGWEILWTGAHLGESIASTSLVFKARQSSEIGRSKPRRLSGTTLSSCFPFISEVMGDERDR